MMSSNGWPSRAVSRLVPVLALVVLASFASPVADVSAQVTPEVSASVLLETAAAFERDGEWEIAEAIYEFIVQNYRGTSAATEARARLNSSAADRPARISRVELQVFGTVYGLWLGVAVPAALGADEPEAYGAGLLIGGPLGLFGSRAAIRSRQFSEGQARTVSWGGIWGTWQGYGWTELLNIGEQEYCDPFNNCYPDGGNEEELWAGAVLGGIAGIATGAIIAKNPINSGVASLAQGASTWGSIYGAMAAATLDEDPGDAALASALIVGNVGLLAGAALASKYEVSRPRARVITLGALLGLVAGGGVDLLVQPDDSRVGFGIPLVASMVGAGIAIHSTRGDRATSVEAEEANSLLAWRDGQLMIGTPMPLPAMLPFEDENGRPSWRPGLSMELFRASF